MKSKQPATIYICDICGRQSEDKNKIIECEAQGSEEPVVQVGDFVQTDSLEYGRFGWFDGDEKWTEKKINSLHNRGGWQGVSLIYVVTAITQEGHRLCYHLFTKGMTGDKGYRSGYTHPATHLSLRKVEAPNLDGSDLIGKKSRYLV